MKKKKDDNTGKLCEVISPAAEKIFGEKKQLTSEAASVSHLLQCLYKGLR
jgi:hypothetical protein